LREAYPNPSFVGCASRTGQSRNFSRKGAKTQRPEQIYETNWKKYLFLPSELGVFAPLREAIPNPSATARSALHRVKPIDEAAFIQLADKPRIN